ncbi:kinase-like domain-containing protein [Syncephalis fuscata]|nr:kinase-like domain-containing protein [Syncephalis fuscata]
MSFPNSFTSSGDSEPFSQTESTIRSAALLYYSHTADDSNAFVADSSVSLFPQPPAPSTASSASTFSASTSNSNDIMTLFSLKHLQRGINVQVNRELLIRSNSNYTFGNGYECDYTILDAAAPERSFRIYMDGSFIKCENINETPLNVNDRVVKEKNILFFWRMVLLPLLIAEAVGSKYVITSALLGSGTFGEVRLAVDKATNKRIAIKQMAKKLDESGRRQNRLLVANHTFMVNVLGDMVTDKFNYIALDNAEGGNLNNYLELHRPLLESAAQYITHQLMHGLKFLHKNNILHRDIKPANILLRGHHMFPHVMYSDFGLSRRSSNSIAQAFTISAHFLEGYGKEIDVWSMGITICHLFSGFFEGFTDNYSLVNKMLTEKLQFNSKVWKGVTAQAMNFIAALLNPSSSSRYTAEMALEDPWLSEPLDILAERYHDCQLAQDLKDLKQAEEAAQVELVQHKANAEPVQDKNKREPEELVQYAKKETPASSKDSTVKDKQAAEQASLAKEEQEEAKFALPPKLKKRQLSHASENKAEEGKHNKLDDGF